MARVTEEGLAAQIRALSPGQTFSRTRRLSMEEVGIEIGVTEALQKLRNLVNQAVGRIRKEATNGSNFRVESTVGTTSDHSALLATVAVTRMDGTDSNDGDDEIDI